jgi:hypothetical protein
MLKKLLKKRTLNDFSFLGEKGGKAEKFCKSFIPLQI